jgi:phage tail protein X
MRTFASLVIGTALAALAAACSAPSGPTPLSSSAEVYFFQPDLTQVYTYSQDQAATTDTFAYHVYSANLQNTYNSYLMLQRKDSSVLYYFKNKQTSDGTMECLLANSPTDNGFVALKGTLDLGATWYADTAQNIQVTVVGKYAEYYLPGREVHYSDVVVVKYTDKTSPSGNYIVRYFARTYGLISELTITGANTQIADLQLLLRQGSPSSANPDNHHDRWFNANGRSVANIRQEDGLDK